MKKIILFIAFLLILINFSNAQTGETELYSKLEKQEVKLDSVYSKLEKSISEIDRLDLTKSQNAWLKFRNLNCSFKSQENSQGGVISNKLKINCKIQSTKERIIELTDLINEF